MQEASGDLNDDRFPRLLTIISSFNLLILSHNPCLLGSIYRALPPYVENDRKGLINGLIATVFLGFVFSCFQAYEYHHASFTIDGNIYGSTFYMATGFHGFHVIVGTIFLAVCLYRSIKGHFKPDHHFGFEAAAWYWHFVDVVWLFLFAAIYIWGS